MLDFLKNIFKKKQSFISGVYLGGTSKLGDQIDFKEIVAKANFINWVEKKDWRSFPKLDQGNTGMCGAFSISKIMGIIYWLKYGVFNEFSQAHIYQRRMNRPLAGMWDDDIYNIASEGVALKEMTKEEISSDYEADSLIVDEFAVEVGKGFSVGKKINVPSVIDTIASVIHTTGKPLMFKTFFTSSEWSRKYPVIHQPGLQYSWPSTLRHYVVAVDFGLINGKKYIKIEDSAGFGGLHERWISEEWINQRCPAVHYPMNFKYQKDDTAVIPVFDIYDDLQFGNNNPQVRNLQEMLKADGSYPSNVDCTGYFGNVTREAVIKFQVKYNITPSAGYVGQKTKQKLQELFN